MEQAANPVVVLKPTITEEQEQQLLDLMEIDDYPSEALNKMLVKLRCASLKEMDPSKYDKAYEWLQDRIREQQKTESADAVVEVQQEALV
jgi:hypothetical protein